MKPPGDSSVLGAARDRFQGPEHAGLGSVLTCHHLAPLVFSQVTLVFQSPISTFPKMDVNPAVLLEYRALPGAMVCWLSTGPSRVPCEAVRPGSALPHPGPVCQLLVPLDQDTHSTSFLSSSSPEPQF